MLGLARRCTQSNRILRNDFVFMFYDLFEKLSFCDRSGSSNVYKVVVLSLKLDFSVRYEAPNIELQLSGEITGSLRTLKVGGLVAVVNF